MTGLLRFIGLLNAAVWFGAAVFFAVGVQPAVFSPEMRELLGRNAPYYSAAMARIVAGHYYYLEFACGLVALVHLLAEWLYFGHPPQRLRMGLLMGLVLLSLFGGLWLQPKLKQVARQYTQPAAHVAANHAFRTWQGISLVVNWLTVAGLGLYLWRVATPREPTRFVSATKFRS